MRLLNSDIFYIGLGCFIISFLICKLMVLVHLSDNPNHRSIHIKTNPTGGGLGIIAALGFSLILINTFIPEVPLSKDLPYFLVCAIIISFLGVLDDIFEIMTSYDTKHALLHWFDGSKKQLQKAMDMDFFVSFGPVMIYANDKQSLLSKSNESKILVETDGPVRFSRCFEMKSGQISFIPSVIFCASKVLEKTFDDMSCLLEKNTKRYLGI